MELKPILKLTAAATGALLIAGAAFAADMPGKGVEVIPLKSSIAEETFQTVLVMKALEELGYTVEPIKELEYAAAHVAIGNGDGTFLADHWDPLHIDFFNKAGGDAKIYRKGVYSPGALQGYLIDKKTSDKYGITNIGQLKDPKLAKLFDSNGDGTADLSGCNPGWGCEKVIEHQLDAFGLRKTVTHNQGSYSAIIADTISRVPGRRADPVLHLDPLLDQRRAGAGQGRRLAERAVQFAAGRPQGRRYLVAGRQQLRFPGQRPADHREP